MQVIVRLLLEQNKQPNSNLPTMYDGLVVQEGFKNLYYNR